jgi:ABC-type phosphate transport system substrate-binding protein
MRAPTTLIALLFAACLGAGLPAQAADPVAVQVLVSRHNNVKTLTRQEAVAYFTGRTATWPGGEQVQPLDLPLDHPARETFYRLLTGMSLAQINSYWARLVFSGQIQPPRVVGSEAAMADALRNNPNAVGYLVNRADEAPLRVVLVLKPAT